MTVRARRTDLPTSIGSVRLPNPIMTASGTSGHGAELADHFDLADLGAVVVKSLHPDPWDGNPSPRVHATPAGMINSVGLQGPGVSAWLEEDLPALVASGARVVASIWGRTVDEFARAASLLADAPSQVVAVEVNASCPNLEDRRRLFAHSATATAEVVEATAAANRPRWAKLSPNTYDLPEVAGAAAAASPTSLDLTTLDFAYHPAGRFQTLPSVRDRNSQRPTPSGREVHMDLRTAVLKIPKSPIF